MRETTYNYDMKLMRKPLLAWKYFTKRELIKKKAMRILELEEKLKLLEKRIAKFSAEKSD